MKRVLVTAILLVVLLAVWYYLERMDYIIPLANGLFVENSLGLDPYAPERACLTKRTGANTRSAMVRGLLAYGEQGVVTYGQADEGYFIVRQGTDVRLYDREEDWGQALNQLGVTEPHLRKPSRLRSPDVWYAAGILGAVAGTLVAVVAGVAMMIRRWRRRHPGCCEVCGYDLTANVSGVCPECGSAIGPSEESRVQPSR